MRRICDAYATCAWTPPMVGQLAYATHMRCWGGHNRTTAHLSQLPGLQPLPDHFEQVIDHIDDAVEAVRGGVVHVHGHDFGVHGRECQRPVEDPLSLAQEAVGLALVVGEGQHVLQPPLGTRAPGLVVVELPRLQQALGADAPTAVGHVA